MRDLRLAACTALGLFLVEPTLGLDITLQERIPRVHPTVKRRYDATLSSPPLLGRRHAAVRRIIVIDLAGSSSTGAALHRRAIAPYKVISIDLQQDLNGYAFDRLGQVLSHEGRKLKLRVAREEAPAVTSRLLADLAVLDLTIEDPPIEDIIRQVFAGQAEASLP